MPDPKKENIGLTDDFFDQMAKEGVKLDLQRYDTGIEPRSLNIPTTSQYDKGFIIPDLESEQKQLDALNEHRENAQGFWDSMGNATVKLALKTATKTAQGISDVLIGIPSAIASRDINQLFDNPISKGITTIEESINEGLPNYNSQKDIDKNILERAFTDLDFWTNDIMSEGVPFLASAYLTGTGMAKVLGPATKALYANQITKANQAAMDAATKGVFSEATANALQEGKLAAQLGKIDQGLISFGARTVESLAEGKQTRDEVFTNLMTGGEQGAPKINPNTNKPYTEQEAKTKAGRAAMATSLLNYWMMPIEYMQAGSWMKTFSNSRKSILKEVGDKLVTDTKLQKFGKEAFKNAITEGYEESFQKGIQDYIKDKYTGNYTDSEIGSVLDIFSPLADITAKSLKNYTTKEGWDAIGQGMILGGLFGAAAETFGSGAKRENEKINKLKQLIKDNDYLKGNISKAVEVQEDGSVKVNDKNITELFKSQLDFERIEGLKQAALLNNDEEAFKTFDNIQFANWAYTHFEAGLGDKLEHQIESIKNLEDPEIAKLNPLTNSEGRILTASELSNRYLEKAKQLEKLYNSVQERYNVPDPIRKQLFEESVIQNETLESLNKLNQKILPLDSKIFNANSLFTAEELRDKPLSADELELKDLKEKQEDYKKTLKDSYKRFADLTDPKKIEEAAAKQKEIIEKHKKESSKKEEEFNTPSQEPAKSENVNKPAESFFEQTPEDVNNTPSSTGTMTQTNPATDKVTGTVTTQSTPTSDNVITNPFSGLTGENVETPAEPTYSIKGETTTTEKVEQESLTKEAVLKPYESSDEEQSEVSTTMTNSTNATISEQEEFSGNTEESIKLGDVGDNKSLAAVPNVAMMHLYNHIVEWKPFGRNSLKRIFKWVHGDDGLVIRDNTSGIDEKALNNLKIGDKVYFQLQTVNNPLNDQRVKSIPENARGLTEGYYEAIAIRKEGSGELLGYVQLPHEAKEGRTPAQTEEYAKVRERIITERKSIISKLKNGERVVTTISDKGRGNLLFRKGNKQSVPLYNQIDENTKIPYSIFNNVPIREKDKVGGQAVFAYISKNKATNQNTVVIPSLEDESQRGVLEKDSANLASFGKVGQVFMLVKAANGQWSGIPVYSTLVTPELADEIVDVISNLEPKSVNDVIRALNDYVYVTGEDKTTGQIKAVVAKDGFVGYVIGKDKYSLEKIKTSSTVKEAFKKALTTLKQNISVANINTDVAQEKLKSRQTLATNAYTDNGEYFVQPFVTFKPTVDPKDEALKELEDNRKQSASSEQSTTISTSPKKDIGNDGTMAFKEKSVINKVTTPEDVRAFRQWLSKTLPQFDLTVEDFEKLKALNPNSWGAFSNMIIYLNEGAPKGTGFHEAFHGVFRSLLTLDERKNVLEIAKKLYEAPTEQRLTFLNERHPNLTRQELIDLAYEEKLADEYSTYTQTYTESSFIKRLGTIIVNLFKKISQFFNLIKTSNSSQLEMFFNSINRGKFSTTKPLYTTQQFDVAYAPIGNLNNTYKATKILTIANKIVAENMRYLGLGISQEDITLSSLFNPIFANYEKISKDPNHPGQAAANELFIHRAEVEKQVKKHLNGLGFKFNNKEKQIKDIPSTIDDTTAKDIEQLSAQGNLTKSFGDVTSIPGMKSASTRLKLFLAGIEQLDENGNVKKDDLGETLYHDMKNLYYSIERKLLGVYSFEEQVAKLKEWGNIRPEFNQVVDKLINNREHVISKEEQERIKSDFKTNFSKDQLKFILTKASVIDGGLKVEIIDSNRTDIRTALQDEWKNAYISSSNNDTVADISADGTVTTNGTDKAKKLAKDTLELLEKAKADPKNIRIFDPKIISKLLSKTGIILSNDTIVNESKIDSNYISMLEDLNTIATHLAKSKEEASNSEIAYREAFKKFADREAENQLSLYTSSFTNGENKNVYSIQLPTFASKMMNKLIADRKTFKAELASIKQDSFYEHSNLLNALNTNDKFRQEKFKLEYFDALKNEAYGSEGAVYDNIQERDFLAASIALFENASSNQGTSTTAHKYVYLTPADKSMGMIIQAMSYDVKTKDGKFDHTSPILNNYVNVVLSEIERLRGAIELREFHKANPDVNIDHRLRENFHYKKKSSKFAFDGRAFEFNFIPEVNSLIKELDAYIVTNPTTTAKQIFSLPQFNSGIKNAIYQNLSAETEKVVIESLNKGIIKKDAEGNYSIFGLTPMTEKGAELNNAIVQRLAKFSLNQKLFNIEFSNLVNGDIAGYKPGDEPKRVYQVGSFVTNNNFTKDTKVKISISKDITEGKDGANKLPEMKDFEEMLEADGLSKQEINQYLKKYNDTNTTDAQLLITPDFYKQLHESRGTWSSELQTAHDIAEGIIKNPSKEQLSKAFSLLSATKPFIFTKVFNQDNKKWEYIQIKCATLTLYNNILEDNNTLKKLKNKMLESGAHAHAFESTLKAFLPFRKELQTMSSEDFNNTSIIIDADSFGIQQDNPNHMVEEENDALRQLKMLIPGAIDPNLTYNGISGKEILDSIQSLEAQNIQESLIEFKSELYSKGPKFKQMIQEHLTKRGSTENVEKALELLANGDFRGAMDGPYSRDFQYLIGSLFTNRVIKQAFVGGSAVQASSMGFKFNNLTEQQKAVDNDITLKNLQSSLKYVFTIDKDGNKQLAHIECAMPVPDKRFLKEDGTPMDIKDVPEELIKLIAYRIPTEGLHSMLPIKIVKFLPATTGNYILLPAATVTQLGSDFDFDKIYFLSKAHKNLEEIKNDTTINGRNNKILDHYWNLLTAKENFRHLIKPSGFDELEKYKQENFPEIKQDSNFFSGITQRALKQRNGLGKQLKGLATREVSGHAWSNILGLTTKTINVNGEEDASKFITFDFKKKDNISERYSTNGKTLITDELGTMLAAVMDDLKNPILEALNINLDTYPVWALIVEAGFGTKTALDFITQPVLKDLSSKLALNRNKLREEGEPYHTNKTLFAEYQTKKTNAIKDLLDENGVIKQEYAVDLQTNFKIEDVKKLDEMVFLTSVDTNKLLYFRDLAKNLNNARPAEKAVYYAFQLQVLKRFSDYSSIANDISDTKRYFTLNKEVGPTLEDVLSIDYLYNKIQDSNNIQGFDLSKLPQLAVLGDVHEELKNFYDIYYPYMSSVYHNIKETVAIGQNKPLNILNSTIRTTMDLFISSMLTQLQPNSIFVTDRIEKERLIREVPQMIRAIKNPKNDEKYANGRLRNSPFFQNITVNYKGKLGTIKLKGGALDESLKNQISDSLLGIWNQPNWKNIVVDLLKYSYLYGGHFTGIGSYHNLTPFEIFEQLNLIDYKKQSTKELNDSKFNITTEQVNRIKDQLIRSFAKDLTNVFKKDLFFEHKDNAKDKKIHDILTTSLSIAKATKNAERLTYDDNEEIKFVEYIRVYQPKGANLMYKLTETQGENATYTLTTPLGKRGLLVETDIYNDIETSILPENNEGIEKEIMESVIDTNTLNDLPEGVEDSWLQQFPTMDDRIEIQDITNVKISSSIDQISNIDIVSPKGKPSIDITDENNC